MKKFLAIVGGLVILGVVGLVAFGVAVGRGWIPTPQWMNDQLSEEAGKKMVFVPSTAVSRALPGRWLAENGSLKGSTFTFTKSGRVSMTIPVEGLFRDTDCSMSGSYLVVNGRLRMEFTSHDGHACKSDIKEPHTMGAKIDMVDENRMLLDETNLVREN